MLLLRRWGLAGLFVLTAFALWLLLAGPAELLGVDTGKAGMALLVTSSWVALYALSTLPRGGLEHVALEHAASPGEWRAWIGVLFLGVAVAYFVAKLQLFAEAPIFNNPHAKAVGSNLALLLIAWAVLSRVLRGRWRDRVQEDERDREIAARANAWGRGALTFQLIVLAVLLAFSPAQRLLWATPTMIAHALILALMVGSLIEYTFTAVSYWRDRQ